MWTFPFRYQNDKVLSCLEEVSKVHSFCRGIASTMPSIVCLKLFLQDDDSIPDIVIIETTILIKSFLFLPNWDTYLTRLGYFQNPQRNIKSWQLLRSSFNVDSYCAYCRVTPFCRKYNIDFIEIFEDIVHRYLYFLSCSLKRSFCN